jgi:hypothetical protein
MSLFSRFRKPPSPAEQLERLLEAARNDSSRRNEFYRALLASELCVPGTLSDGELLIQPYDLGGRKTFLLFTSPERMVEGLLDRPEHFAIEGATLFAALPAFDVVVLNYRTRMQKEFTPSEVQALLDGTIFHAGGSDDAIILGKPKSYPVQLMETLKAKLPARPEVRAAYLAQLFDPATMDAPRIVIAFETDMDEGGFDMLCGNAARIAEACGAEDIIFRRLENDAVGEYMRREAGAFYRLGEG